MKFKTDDLLDEVFEEVYDKIIGHSRGSIKHEKVFKHEGKFYITHYSVGATEYQEEYPYEDEGDEIECAEVFPVEKVITVYEVDK